MGQDGAPPLFEKVGITDSNPNPNPNPTPTPLKVWITDSVPATVAAVTSDSETNACLPPFEVRGGDRGRVRARVGLGVGVGSVLGLGIGIRLVTRGRL